MIVSTESEKWGRRSKRAWEKGEKDRTSLTLHSDDLEYFPVKADGAVRIVKLVQAAGAPIHGVGLQASVEERPDVVGKCEWEENGVEYGGERKWGHDDDDTDDDDNAGDKYDDDSGSSDVCNMRFWMRKDGKACCQARQLGIWTSTWNSNH